MEESKTYCSNCNHYLGERCDNCGSEFLCGSVSVPCEECGEGVMNPKYKWPSELAVEKEYREVKKRNGNNN